MWRPPSGETYWEYFQRRRRKGTAGFKEWFMLFTRLPDITFPWGGERGYWKLYDQYGPKVIVGPGASIFWWRTLWHVFGGATLGIGFGALPFRQWLPLVVGVAIFVKEFWLDCEWKIRRWDIKNTIDLFAWVLPTVFWAAAFEVMLEGG